MIFDWFFLIFLAIVSITDLLKGKIYNWVTFSATVIGIAGNTFLGGANGFLQSVIGSLICFLFFAPFFFVGGIGAGDVKFMMATGSFKGWNFSLIGGIYGAIIAGITFLFLLVIRKKLIETLKKMVQVFCSLILFRKVTPLSKAETFSLPYSPFLALGLLIRWIQVTYC